MLYVICMRTFKGVMRIGPCPSLRNGDDVIIILQWWFSHAVLEESYNGFGLQKITFSKAQWEFKARHIYQDLSLWFNNVTGYLKALSSNQHFSVQGTRYYEGRQEGVSLSWVSEITTLKDFHQCCAWIPDRVLVTLYSTASCAMPPQSIHRDETSLRLAERTIM